jgi:hypothetical protein
MLSCCKHLLVISSWLTLLLFIAIDNSMKNTGRYGAGVLTTKKRTSSLKRVVDSVSLVGSRLWYYSI